MTQMTKKKDYPLFEQVSQEEWNDWRWQVENRIDTVDELQRIFELGEEEVEGIEEAMELLRMGITPYYAGLMKPEAENDPVRLMAVPTKAETQFSPGESRDPLHEEADSPVEGLTHRYPDRVLFLLTDKCAMYCRHCTRRRFAGETDQHAPPERIEAGIEYIEKTPEVRDVSLSGGDVLMLEDDQLEGVLKRLRQIDHVEIIRLGTRAPVVCPQRITEDLVEMVRKYHPVYCNTHFNHPREITPEAAEACRRLADAGIQVGNQTVLLKGVNDCPFVIKELCQKLLTIRVTPYYLYQCDPSLGLSHFRTTIAKGIEVIEHLRGHTSGLAIPTYVVDLPGGGGKVPVSPQYLLSRSDGKAVLRNYEGMISSYQEPAAEPRQEDVCPLCGQDHSEAAVGIAGMLAE